MTGLVATIKCIFIHALSSEGEANEERDVKSTTPGDR
jgi:hypothetical protein